MASPRPAEYVHPGRSRRQHRAHPVVWLDRDLAACHRCDRSAQQPGASAEIDDDVAPVRQQPVDSLSRGSRAKPVVVVSDRATDIERSARSVTFVTLTFLDRAFQRRPAIAPDKPPRGQA
jgi:hypothetical protein